MGMFDALALAVDKPSRMVIVDPVTREPLIDSDGNGGYIDLLSRDSKVSQEHNQAILQKRIDSKGLPVNAKNALDNEKLLLARLTKGWRLVGLDRSALDVPCSEQNAYELYTAHELTWLHDQVNDYLNNRANFSKASSTS